MIRFPGRPKAKICFWDAGFWNISLGERMKKSACHSLVWPLIIAITLNLNAIFPKPCHSGNFWENILNFFNSYLIYKQAIRHNSLIIKPLENDFSRLF